MPQTMTIEHTVKSLALEIGFDRVGITDAGPFVRDEAVAIERVRDGLMDGLPWYTEERVRRMNRPRLLLEGARSVISLALSYNTGDPPDDAAGLRGKIARYAWGRDYHSLIKARVRRFIRELPDVVEGPVRARYFVDDGPMNDRAPAERSGLGWFGKNTNILTPTHGSWVFLAEVVTDLDLTPDPPLKKTCGECVRCIPACPTGAIVAPYVIDNRKCISFLTIELRGAIPRELRPLMGDWVFGCDICQEVCPVNRKAAPTLEAEFRKRHDFDAPELLPAAGPGRRRLQGALQRQPDPPRAEGRATAQRVRCARQHRRSGRRARAGRCPDGRRAAGAGARRLGARADRRRGCQGRSAGGGRLGNRPRSHRGNHHCPGP